MTPVRSGSAQPYPWHSLGIFGSVALGIGYLMFMRAQIPLFSPRPQPSVPLMENTYLMVHFPPVYSREAAYLEKAESWLSALSAKGYQPALLSDVYRRLEQGRGLSEKTVVILFDPSYRSTFEVMAPLLAKYKFPAVWINDRKVQRSGDTRFVSNHVLKAMKKSENWDVGHYEGKSGLIIEGLNTKPISIGGENGAWLPGAGRRALNRGVPEGHLNRLHVNWDWNGEQIVDRLQAEEPLSGRGFLTFKRIQNMNWGVVLAGRSTDPTSFKLKAANEARNANLSWLGTKWCENATLHIEAKALTGELWIMLRSDEVIGENVGVCFLNGKLSITAQSQHETRHLADLEIPALKQPASFSAEVVLNGPDLSVFMGGRRIAQAKVPPEPVSAEGKVRLKMYDKIAGAAQVESLKISMARIQKNSKNRTTNEK